MHCYSPVTVRHRVMNWQHYKTVLSSQPAVATYGGLLKQKMNQQRHDYLVELRNSSAARVLYQSAYLPYLAQRAKEFQPTVIATSASVLEDSKQTYPSSPSPKSSIADESEKGGNAVAVISSSTRSHLCQVCSDSASGVHYGVQTCEGCKSFFKRSLQGKGQSFACAADNKCQVDKRLRRNCAACRLRVCHQVGMKSNGVRKRKVEKMDKLPTKMLKVETPEEQLELRGSQFQHRQTNQSSTHHQLSLSLVSLPSSPNPSEGNQSIPSSPSVRRESSCGLSDNRQQLTQNLTSQFHTNNTIGLEREDYEGLDKRITSGTALCQLFQNEIPTAIQWVKQIPDYKILPIEDQINLTRSKCMELLVMSVVCSSCTSDQKCSQNSLHFALSNQQYRYMAKEKDLSDKEMITDPMKEKIREATVAPLKAYAAETFSSIQKAVAHYGSINATRMELETLKLLIFTNTDSSAESNMGNVELLHQMKQSFRTHLRLLCVDRLGPREGEKRYEELLLSLTIIRDLSTRLESCMIQQSEVSTTLNAIYTYDALS